MTAFEFRVEGIPVPQGSKRIGRMGGTGGGRPIILDANDRKLRPWRNDVTAAAMVAARGQRPTVEAVTVRVDLFMPRPKSAKRARPSVKPDVDKLARGVLDSLTGVLFVDDSQVVELHARKWYATASDPPGARITITALGT